MYKNKYITSGRMSELFGERALCIDKFSRSLGYQEIAKSTFASLEAPMQNALQAYADGVNDFVASVHVGGYVHLLNDFFVENFGIGDGSANLLPPEFYLLGVQLEPWTPVDSLASINLIGFSLTWDWARDMLREFNKLENE